MLKFGRLLLVLAALAAVAGCTHRQPAPDGDPFEAQNREVHKLNTGLDRAVVRPVAYAFGEVVPTPVRAGLRHVAANLALPGMVVNNVLQGNVAEATSNSLRFAFNTTFGLAGLLDIATEAGLPEAYTDFGETLYVWGVPEGAYVELPVVGPSTSRHAVGRLVDAVINPLNAVTATPERGNLAAIRIGSVFETRDRLGDTIDQILYESADSYAQSRLIYLQNRRFTLEGEAPLEDFDPYADVYDDQ